ncbi:MAG: helix-turn-helix domain-containing protein [Firmicutes bacterium]|nr:helix-turn-helix domain-containing protein [Bacillota bacterium]
MDDTPGQASNPTLSIHEAAQHLGVSDKTLRRWIKAGKLPAFQEEGPYGPMWRIPATALQTAQQVIDVVPVNRPVEPQTLGLIIAQAVAQETQPLLDAIQHLQAQVAALTQTLNALEQQRRQDAEARDAAVVRLIRDALTPPSSPQPKRFRWWPWQK